MKIKSLIPILFLAIPIATASHAEDINVSISIKQNIGGKSSNYQGELKIKNFPRTVSEHMAFNASIYRNGKILCSGKIRTVSYQAYFSTKCIGKTYKGNSSINRTIRIASRKINFIKKVRLKSGPDYIEIVTGSATSLSSTSTIRKTTQKKITKPKKTATIRRAASKQLCYFCKGSNITTGKYCMSAVDAAVFISDSLKSCKKL